MMTKITSRQVPDTRFANDMDTFAKEMLDQRNDTVYEHTSKNTFMTSPTAQDDMNKEVRGMQEEQAFDWLKGELTGRFEEHFSTSLFGGLEVDEAALQQDIAGIVETVKQEVTRAFAEKMVWKRMMEGKPEVLGGEDEDDGEGTWAKAKKNPLKSVAGPLAGQYSKLEQKSIMMSQLERAIPAALTAAAEKAGGGLLGTIGSLTSGVLDLATGGMASTLKNSIAGNMFSKMRI